MSRSFHRRLWVSLLSAAAAYVGWTHVPGTGVDRTFFRIVMRGFSNPPLLVSGEGSHDDPWSIRTLADRTEADPQKAPVMISLADDPENFFQSSPPSPVDFAVIFRNTRRLGATTVASGAVLSWEAPDPVSLAALENTMASFEKILTAAPLSRGAVATAMPPSFRRASLPLSAVRGDASALPVVNRIPISNIILGGDNAISGFTRLESESASEAAPASPALVAKWEDRVVLAFPVLVVLEKLGLPVEGVEVRAGESLQLGKNGPVVPLDRYGRLDVHVRNTAARKLIGAEALIDATEPLFPASETGPVVLRDDQSAAEATTREFSRGLSGVIAAIASGAGMTEAKPYPRLCQPWEIWVLGTGVFLLMMVAGRDDFARRLGFLLTGCGILVCHWVMAGFASIWLPSLALLAATVAAFIGGEIIPSPPQPHDAPYRPRRGHPVARETPPAEKNARADS